MIRYVLTVLLAVVWVSAARPQTAEEKRQTIAYLNRLQTDSGAFVGAAPNAQAKPGQPSLRATTAALRAYRYFGGEVPHREKVVQFVKGCFNKSSGGFTDAPGKGKPDVFTTASGIMAVVELKLPADDYLDVVQFFDKNVKTFDELRIAVAGLEAIHKPMPRSPRLKQLIREIDDSLEVAREKKAPKVLARQTGGNVVTLLRLGEKVPREAKMLELLRDGQQRDGGYSKENSRKSDLESTYRVERGLMMLKTHPKDIEAMRSFVAKCRNEDGGYGVQPGAPSSVGATYFASIVIHWLNNK